MSKLWIPAVKGSDITFSHRPTNRGGRFTTQPNKIVLHTTEGMDFHAMSSVLVSKSAEPHFLLGKVGDRWHAEQFIPLNLASRALEHPSGTPDTNNAGCIQIEICEFAKNAPFHDELMKALAHLCLRIESRTHIPRKRPRMFHSTPHRFTPSGFARVKGYVGHEHVPSQPSGHWDPGKFDCRHLFKLMERLDK